MDPGPRRDGLLGSYRMFGVRPDPYRDQNREYHAAFFAHFDLKYLIFIICAEFTVIVIRYLSVICFTSRGRGVDSWYGRDGGRKYLLILRKRRHFQASFLIIFIGIFSAVLVPKNGKISLQFK